MQLTTENHEIKKHIEQSCYSLSEARRIWGKSNTCKICTCIFPYPHIGIPETPFNKRCPQSISNVHCLSCYEKYGEHPQFKYLTAEDIGATWRDTYAQHETQKDYKGRPRRIIVASEKIAEAQLKSKETPNYNVQIASDVLEQDNSIVDVLDTEYEV